MDKSRRSFLFTGAAAVPAALSVSSLINAEPIAKGEFAQTHNFLIHPEVLARFNDRFEVISASPWAISKEDADLLPYILGQRQLGPGILDNPELAGRSSKGSADSSRKLVLPHGISFDRLASFQVHGEIPVSDIAGDINLARMNNQSLELSLNFADAVSKQTKARHHYSPSDKFMSLTLLPANAVRTGSSPFVPLYIRIPIPIPFTNYSLQFRGPDTGHRMTDCAPEARSHYHLEVFRKTGIGSRTVTVANFHVAIWKSGRQVCFAIANSEGRPVCFKKCTPKFNDIKNAVQASLIRVGIPLAIAAVMAAILAGLIVASPALVIA